MTEEYPRDTAKFIHNEKDLFANPVGGTIKTEIPHLLDALLQDNESEKLSEALDNIVRIKAVQEFSPSQAAGFVFILKEIIRDELSSELGNRDLVDELLVFESRIDQLALMSFDLYMNCREQIHAIKFNQLKKQTSPRVQGLESRSKDLNVVDHPCGGTPDKSCRNGGHTQ